MHTYRGVCCNATHRDAHHTRLVRAQRLQRPRRGRFRFQCCCIQHWRQRPGRCDCGHRLSTAVAAQCPAWCAMAVPYVPNAAVFVDRSASQASERNCDSEPSHAVVGQADRSGLGFDDSAKHRLLCGAELDAVCACCAARRGQLVAGLCFLSFRFDVPHTNGRVMRARPHPPVDLHSAGQSRTILRAILPCVAF